MNTSAIAVLLIFAVALLVMGIELAHQKMTTGIIDMKAARRWFYRTVGAALVLLAGLAIFDFAGFGPMNAALSDAQAGADAARRHDADMAIVFYTKALDAGTLNSDTQADVFKARGMARLQKQDWDAAVSDFTEASKRKPDDPEAYFGMGIAYSSQGDNDAALHALDRTIGFKENPDNILPDAYAARGDVYLTLGQYQRGIQDFDEALRRRPKDAGALGGRGEGYFYLGQFDKAETDLSLASEQDPKMAYYPLWLYLTQAHQKKDADTELDARSAKLDLKSWPGPVVDFYRGKSTADQVTAAAGEGDTKTQQGQHCEADFYLGEHALLKGDKSEAARLLGEAVDMCDHRFIEYMGAKAELGRLSG
jgi:lipoprotein NlpI